MGEFASMTLICVVVVWVLATLREWLSPWVSEYGNNWRQPPTLGEVLRSQWQWFVALVKTGRVPR